jgi:hypothetical protein
MPSLLRLGCEAAPSRAAVEEMSKTVEEALATAEASGYRIDALFGQETAPDEGEEAGAEVESEAPGPEQPQTEEPEAQEPVIESPVEDDPVEPV